MPLNICVLGAGVMGLSTACNVIEKVSQIYHGIQVDLIAEKFSPHTTSDVAPGIWRPHNVPSASDEKMREWGEATMKHLLSLVNIEDAGNIGVFEISGYEVYRRKTERLPAWRNIVKGFHEMTQQELQALPGYTYGYSFSTAKIDCTSYLPWLTRRFTGKGGRIFQRKINSIEELFPKYSIVVNCTGIGARHLAYDSSLEPARGQVLRVKAPWVKKFIFADEDHHYIIPGSEEVVLGGTFEMANWNTGINYTDKEDLKRGCIKLMPSLKGAQHVSDWVGLRPCRPQVRVERSSISLQEGRLQVVHNYGHGGSGITFHWGCALESAQLVLDALREIKSNSKL